LDEEQKNVRNVKASIRNKCAFKSEDQNKKNEGKIKDAAKNMGTKTAA